MPKAPDLESLAKTYLDLWQDQFASLAADPAMADAMARLFGAMAGGWSSMGGVAGQPAAPGVSDGKGSPGDEERAGAAAGTAAAAAALRNRSDGLPELLERIARLERRLDALEHKSGRKGGGAKGGASKG